MSEATPEAGQQTSPEGAEQQAEAKIFDVEYVDKLRKEAAKYRTEAKANADAAKRLSDIEEAQKSETEKTADRIAKAEAEVASIPSKVADALREHLVDLHKIDKDDADLFLTGTDPELLLKQVTRLLGQADTRKQKNNVSPREGNNPSSADGGDDRAFVRQLFASE